jgi:hypothetical protein
MSDPDVLLRALVEEPVTPLPSVEAEALRDRVVGRLDGRRRAALERRARADRRRPWIIFAAAACLPLAVWAAASRTPGLAPRPAGAALVTDIVGRATIGGDEVQTASGGAARASLPSGAIVDIASSSSVRFEGPASAGAVSRDRIELSAGRIDVRVPHLGPGGDLRVHTEDATVVVHGTRFVVEHAGGDGGGRRGTHVGVTEGLVEVDTAQGIRMLTAGMTLDIPPDVPPAVAAEATAPQAHPTQPAPRVMPSIEVAGSTPGPGSTLATENALLAEAMRLRRERRPEPAMARLDDLLARYPASPLAETARVERLRVLDESGATGPLAREAERYLTDYPHGFARAEATAMLAAARSRTP